MRSTAEYILSYRRRNEDILEEIKVDPAGNELAQYMQKWLNSVCRMENSRHTKNSLTIDLSEGEDLNDH